MTTSGDFQLSALEWLLDHHAVKYLGLRPGDVVLDLGCGPGLWTATPLDDGAFDAVFLGNCCCYASALSTVLRKAKRVSRGRVFSKDFDGRTLIYHPAEERLTATVRAAAVRALQETPPQPPFDNFIGRKMHGAFRSAGFRDVETRQYAIQLTSP